MLDHLSSLSFPRLLTLIVLYYAGAHTQGQADIGRTVIFILMGFPFLLGLLVSLLPMEHRIRIVAALTVFSGIGFFLLAIVITCLWAAWEENETGQ